MKSRALQPRVDGLETRNLLSGVSLTGTALTVTPDLTGNNTVVVSYQVVNSVKKVDINLNGVDNLFNVTQVNMVFCNAASTSGNLSFTNDHTSIMTIAYGGHGTNSFAGGIGTDEFVGGAGVNTFNPGTGWTIMAGGSGTNNYQLKSVGGGEVLQAGKANNITNPGGGNYIIL